MKTDLFPRRQSTAQQQLHAEFLFRAQGREYDLCESPGSGWLLLLIAAVSYAVGVWFVTAF